MGGEPGMRKSNQNWLLEIAPHEAEVMETVGSGSIMNMELKWRQQAFSENSHFLEEPMDSS